MPAANGFDFIALALSTTPEYNFGVRTYDFPSNRFSMTFEPVTLNEISVPVCLAPTSEGHGVRGFICTVLWPQGTTAGAVEIDGADLNEELAYHVLGTITFPGVQYSSPSGLVVNFMRMKVVTLPTPVAQIMGRLMIR